jgi:amino acid permease
VIIHLDDGHGSHSDKESGSASSFAASMQIANTIMGAGILGLPVVMRYLGLILGSLLMLFNSVVTIYSIHALLKCKDITQK